jgi:hypothetical protein
MDQIRLTINPDRWAFLLLWAACASIACAQPCPEVPKMGTELYPATPLTYPMTSDRYFVEYVEGTGGSPEEGWPAPTTYITYYGGTNASPYHPYSGYPSPYAASTKPLYLESMSFASIPVNPSTKVVMRVTKLWGSTFPIGQVSIRPSSKPINIDWVSGYTVQISTTTAADFLGEQFVLWWDGDQQESSATEGLAIFLDPHYIRPAGPKVKIVESSSDLNADLTAYDTLDIEGVVPVAFSGTQPVGAQTFLVPANIANVFLGSGAWL